nr:putative capsid protein [Picobirnavirus sp.]
MKKTTENNLRVAKELGSWWIDNIIDQSHVPLRFAKKVFSKLPKTVGDLSQLAVQLLSGDFDDAVNEIIDVINHGDAIESGIQVTVDGVRNFARRTKQLAKNINGIRKDNIKMNKNKNKKSASSSRNTNDNIRNTSVRTSKTNHPEWYLKDKTLIQSLVGVNLSSRNNAIMPGRLGISIATGSGAIGHQFEIGVPKVAGVNMVLTIPKSATNDWEQGINFLYKNIRSANAGSINYSPGQLANYVYSVRSIDAVLSYMARAIGMLNSVEFYDAKAPADYFCAMGLDYDTFAANSANLREVYNRLATIRYRLMPLNVSLLERTRWLFSNVFKDSNDAKGQIYVPALDKINFISSQNDVIGYVISSNNIDSNKTGLEYASFITNILGIFNAFQNDSVFQIIAGDILKAYGAESLNHYPLVANNYTINPVYDEFILMQIQNASLSVTGAVITAYNTDNDFVVETVSENVGGAVVNEGTALNPASIESLNDEWINPFINANVNSLDAGRLLSITRLSTSIEAKNAPTPSDIATVTYKTYGSEVVENIRIVVTRTASTNAYDLDKVILDRYIITGGTIDSALVGTIGAQLWSYFDYFPYVVPVLISANSTQPNSAFWKYCPALFDFNNFGILYKQNLDSYGAICTLSMLHKPFRAKVSNSEVIEA